MLKERKEFQAIKKGRLARNLGSLFLVLGVACGFGLFQDPPPLSGFYATWASFRSRSQTRLKSEDGDSFVS